ncbi:hypothetical protein SNEBB_010894 [Seison nebaliae]|nr:hypothetical protein SNEBB_010894 [Seison nebaliae]
MKINSERYFNIRIMYQTFTTYHRHNYPNANGYSGYPQYTTYRSSYPYPNNYSANNPGNYHGAGYSSYPNSGYPVNYSNYPISPYYGPRKNIPLIVSLVLATLLLLAATGLIIYFITKDDDDDQTTTTIMTNITTFNSTITTNITTTINSTITVNPTTIGTSTIATTLTTLITTISTSTTSAITTITSISTISTLTTFTASTTPTTTSSATTESPTETTTKSTTQPITATTTKTTTITTTQITTSTKSTVAPILTSSILRNSKCSSVETDDAKTLPDDSDWCKNSGRIVGGVNVGDISNYPAVVSLQLSISGDDHLCGGTILNKHWILTAAHCFPSNINLTKSSVRLNSLTTSSSFQRKIDYVLYHSKFTENTEILQNDIAVLRLCSPLTYNDGIRPTCLPNSNYDTTELPTSNQNLTVLGWGLTDEDGKGAISTKLKKVTIPVLLPSSCSITDTKEAFCAGNSNEVKDACQGDSGGPAFSYVNNVFRQLGIVSFGPLDRSCKGTKGGYTRLASYIEWIKASLKKNV